MRQSERIIKNTLFSYAGFLWQLPVSFFLVAFILRHLGGERYGTYILLESMVSCLSLLDFAGVEGSFVKFIAQYYAADDRVRFNQVIGLGFTYYLLFQTVLCSLILLCHRPLFSLFHFQAALSGEVLYLLAGFLFISLVRGSFRVFRSALLGTQRLDLANLIDIAMTVPNLAGTILVLKGGYGLKGLITNSGVMALLTIGLQVLAVRRIAPWVRMARFDRRLFLATFRYGVEVQAARMAELISMQIDKLLLGLLLSQQGKAVVADYELGAKPARVLRDLPSQLLTAILPAAASLDATNQQASLDQLYRRGSKYLAMATVPLLAFTLAEGDLFIRFWLGEPYPRVVHTMQALALAFGCQVLTGTGRLMARGMGLTHFEMRSALVATAVNVVASALCIRALGFNGALCGTVIAGVTGATLFTSGLHRHLGTPFWSGIGRLVYPLPVAASLAGVLVCLPVRALIARGDGWFVSGRPGLAVALGLLALTFAAVYGLLLRQSGFVDAYDREVMARCLRSVRGGRRGEG